MGKAYVMHYKTKLLLTIYRDVVWRIESSIVSIHEGGEDYNRDRISDLIDFFNLELQEYDLVKDKKAIEERLMSLAKTKQVIEIIDQALKHLRTHPKHGEMYHDIITRCYIKKEVIRDEDIARRLHLSLSTYYRYKKQAMELMEVSLWGYILPSLRIARERVE